MKPTAILCGTAMLICYAVLGTVWDATWYLLPLVVMGFAVLGYGMADGRAE